MQTKIYFDIVLTLLVPSASSASSLELASADGIGCSATFMKFVSVLIFVTAYSKQASPWNMKALTFLEYLGGCFQLPDRGVVLQLEK